MPPSKLYIRKERGIAVHLYSTMMLPMCVPSCVSLCSRAHTVLNYVDTCVCVHVFFQCSICLYARYSCPSTDTSICVMPKSRYTRYRLRSSIHALQRSRPIVSLSVTVATRHIYVMCHDHLMIVRLFLRDMWLRSAFRS